MSAILTAINQYAPKAYAGMLAGHDDGHDIESYINNSGTVAGVFDLVFTAVNSTLYTADVYGVHLSYTSDGSAAAAEIRDGIIASAAAQPGLLLKASFAASTNNVRVTELDPAGNGSGKPINLDANTALTVVTPHQEPEAMPAGIVVVRPSTAPAFQDCRLMRASTDFMLGVTMHQHSPVNERTYPAPSALLYPPNSEIGVVRRGKVWVPCEQVMALSDTPFVRYAAGAGGSQLGALRKDADTASALTLSGKARVIQVSIGAAGSVALLQFNFTP